MPFIWPFMSFRNCDPSHAAVTLSLLFTASYREYTVYTPRLTLFLGNPLSGDCLKDYALMLFPLGIGMIKR
jgi:hypothetical protein